MILDDTLTVENKEDHHELLGGLLCLTTHTNEKHAQLIQVFHKSL